MTLTLLLVIKTAMGKKIEPNLYHKPEGEKKGNNPIVFNSHEGLCMQTNRQELVITLYRLLL